MNDILCKEFRTYHQEVGLFNKCTEVLKYLCSYNQHQKDRMGNDNDWFWRRGYRREFEKACGDSLKSLEDKRNKLKNSIIDRSQFLNTICNLDKDELYIATKLDLEEMKYDLTLISTTLNLISDNIFNLDINKKEIIDKLNSTICSIM